MLINSRFRLLLPITNTSGRRTRFVYGKPLFNLIFHKFPSNNREFLHFGSFVIVVCVFGCEEAHQVFNLKLKKLILFPILLIAIQFKFDRVNLFLS